MISVTVIGSFNEYSCEVEENRFSFLFPLPGLSFSCNLALYIAVGEIFIFSISSADAKCNELESAICKGVYISNWYINETTINKITIEIKITAIARPAGVRSQSSYLMEGKGGKRNNSRELK